MKSKPMRKSEIRAIFKDVFSDSNVITPKVIDYRKRGNFLFEISTSNNGKLYGVTVLEILQDKDIAYRPSLGNLFTSKEEVLDYIKNIKSIAIEKENRLGIHGYYEVWTTENGFKVFDEDKD